MIYTDHFHAIAPYRAAVRAAGLTSVESVMNYVGGSTVAWSRTTDTVYVPPTAGYVGFYLKRYRYPTWRHRLRGALRGTFFGEHRAAAEFELLERMRALGLSAVRPVACGARRVAHFLTASFLITEAVPDACNLTTFALDMDAGRRRIDSRLRGAIIERLAVQVAELHRTGFSHGQIFWRNILVRVGPHEQPEFFFLDPRPRRGRPRFLRGGQWWLHELSQLAASALSFTTRAERMRFITTYLGARLLSPDAKQTLRAIERLAQRWQAHERQRIRMCGLFDNWRRALDGAVAAHGSAA